MGAFVGVAVGTSDGANDGACDGPVDGAVEGVAEGETDGLEVGQPLGAPVGIAEGSVVGALLGVCVGRLVGSAVVVGDREGIAVGAALGVLVDCADADGVFVAPAVGCNEAAASLGARVGSLVGMGVAAVTTQTGREVHWVQLDQSSSIGHSLTLTARPKSTLPKQSITAKVLRILHMRSTASSLRGSLRFPLLVCLSLSSRRA